MGRRETILILHSNHAIECAARHYALHRGCNPFITFTGVTSYIGPIMQFVLYNNLSLFLVTIILNIFELSQYIIIILKWLQYGLGLYGHRLNLF